MGREANESSRGAKVRHGKRQREGHRNVGPWRVVEAEWE